MTFRAAIKLRRGLEQVVEVLNPLARDLKSVQTLRSELAELQTDLSEAHAQVLFGSCTFGLLGDALINFDVVKGTCYRHRGRFGFARRSAARHCQQQRQWRNLEEMGRKSSSSIMSSGKSGLKHSMTNFGQNSP